MTILKTIKREELPYRDSFRVTFRVKLMCDRCHEKFVVEISDYTYNQYQTNNYLCRSCEFQNPTPTEFQIIDKEVCRLTNWNDQINLGLFICAECKKTICDCWNTNPLLVGVGE